MKNKTTHKTTAPVLRVDEHVSLEEQSPGERMNFGWAGAANTGTI
jgi:hypothetical protein